MRAARSPAPARTTLLAALRTDLHAAGDPNTALAQQRYMKSAMPYHGVAVPAMRRIARVHLEPLEFDDSNAFFDAVLTLWRDATHREERYIALELLNLTRFAPWRTWQAVPLYEELMVTGAWWDYIDSFAPARLAELQTIEPVRAPKLLRRWAKSEDFWLRRAAILSQMKRKQETDRALLAELIGASFGHPEFFVRKAIGWALREFAYIDPQWVRDFVAAHETELAPLSRREALKHMK